MKSKTVTKQKQREIYDLVDEFLLLSKFKEKPFWEELQLDHFYEEFFRLGQYEQSLFLSYMLARIREKSF